MRNIYKFGDELLVLPAEREQHACTSDLHAWLYRGYVTVRFSEPFKAIRVHTAGVDSPLRPASRAEGKWLLLGDVILTSGELAESRALPTRDPQRRTAFTHQSAVEIPKGSVVNIGLVARKFARAGGGIQGEVVEGPRLKISRIAGFWSNRAANA